MPGGLNNDFPEDGSSPMDMAEYLERFRLRENGGRRLGYERRCYEYTSFIPERRSGFDRRNAADRRKAPRLGSRLAPSTQIPL